MEFRTLRADEIDVRVQSTKQNKNGGYGCVALLYKDARCDMNILDEVVGPMNWKREHTRDNANCIVSLWDTEKKQWISKEDTGTESNTEKEKGLASDSFKRACFNWGIGRELYTAPFVWINLTDKEYFMKDNKPVVTQVFKVLEIGYNDKKVITSLTVIDKTGAVRFTYKEKSGDKPSASEINNQSNVAGTKISKAKLATLQGLIDETKADTIKFCEYFKIKSLPELTNAQYTEAMAILNSKKGEK